MAEVFFITNLVIGQRHPELIQEVKSYVKYSRSMSFDVIIEKIVTMLNDAVKEYKEINRVEFSGPSPRICQSNFCIKKKEINDGQIGGFSRRAYLKSTNPDL